MKNFVYDNSPFPIYHTGSKCMVHTKLKSTPRLLLMGILLLSLAACQPVSLAADTPIEGSAIPAAVAFAINEQGLTAPEEVPSGLVNVTFANNDLAPHVLFVGWLAEGVSAEEILNAPPPGDPSQSNWVNGVFLASGTQVDALLDFTADHHYFVQEVFVEKPAFVEFAATGPASTITAPGAAVTVEAVDFSYIMPDALKAGEQWWQVSNMGTQTHDLGIYKLEGDLTLEALQAQLSALDSQEQAPPPVTAIPSWAVGVGQTTWVKFDLPAGNYVVLCRVPDFSTNPPGPDHWHKGMVHQFTITE